MQPRHVLAHVFTKGQMSARARAYLSIAAARHMIATAVCLAVPELFTTGNFAFIKALMPIPIWGCMFGITALACVLGSALRSDPLARVGLILSAASSVVWGIGFLSAIAYGLSTGPTSGIVWIAIGLKDLVVTRNPMQSPFEDLAERLDIGPEPAR